MRVDRWNDIHAVYATYAIHAVYATYAIHAVYAMHAVRAVFWGSTATYRRERARRARPFPTRTKRNPTPPPFARAPRKHERMQPKSKRAL